jgi:hypothetical protein
MENFISIEVNTESWATSVHREAWADEWCGVPCLCPRIKPRDMKKAFVSCRKNGLLGVEGHAGQIHSEPESGLVRRRVE